MGKVELMFTDPPVTDHHYVEALDCAIQRAIHDGSRVVLDVYDAQQLLRLLGGDKS